MHNSSVMQFDFSRVPQVRAPRSVFNRSHGWKGTFDADWLIPFFVDECVPGDSFNLDCTVLLRLNSPTVRPLMDNLYADTFWFWIPNRLLWSNWKKFMGEQDNPADSINFNVPYVVGPNTASGGVPILHLYDYMGIPVGALSGGGGSTGLQFNNLHGRAYNLVWNQFFRDQNLQNSVTIDVGDGPDTFANYNLLKRGKRFDYFTSCLPNPQKGATTVSLPLGTAAPVVSTQVAPRFVQANQAVSGLRLTTTNGAASVTLSASANATGDLWFDTITGLQTDLTNATAASLNSLRSAITTQQFLERDARGGTRYPELILSHFGVSTPDILSRPELLATYSERVTVTPVPQTAPKGAAGTLTDQGYLAGYGTAVLRRNGFTKSFTEHGVVIGLISVRADLTYTQGLDRMWSRRTRYDFYFPEFANLGEQPVYNQEIYANLPDGTAANQKMGTFGYIGRYDEMRFKNSKITGNLRSYNGNAANANTLDPYTLSEAFSTQPTLGATFIQSNTPLDRAIFVPSQEHFICDAFFDLKCARVMPVFAVPGLNKL